MKIEELKKILDPAVYELLESKVQLQRRYANIEFKILELTDTTARIRISQDMSFHRNHFDNDRLYEIALETFQEALAPRIVSVNTIAYIESPADVIDSDYLSGVLRKNKVKNKDIQAELGLHKTNISAWINGKRPMSKTVRNMFYWYLKAKGWIEN